MTDLEKVKLLLRKKKIKELKKIKKIKNKLPKPFYCEICDKHYTKENKYYHYDSNFHKNNLDNNK